MQTFDSDGVRLAFIDEGAGDPVLLIHGFASSVRTNWIDPGWVSLLTGNGFRVIAIDNRGHGESEKLYDRALYSAPLMAEDARRLLDHLGIPRADVMGYSMGARITAFLALAHPAARAQRHLRRPRRQHGAADGRHRPDRARAGGRQHRRRQEPDRAHLPRLRREDRQRPQGAGRLHPRLARADHARDGWQHRRCPVLVATGTEDVIGGPAEELAALIPGAEALPIPRRDHMLAVGDRVYKEGVLAFLQRRP